MPKGTSGRASKSDYLEGLTEAMCKQCLGCLNGICGDNSVVNIGGLFIAST